MTIREVKQFSQGHTAGWQPGSMQNSGRELPTSSDWPPLSFVSFCPSDSQALAEHGEGGGGTDKYPCVAPQTRRKQSLGASCIPGLVFV